MKEEGKEDPKRGIEPTSSANWLGQTKPVVKYVPSTTAQASQPRGQHSLPPVNFSCFFHRHRHGMTTEAGVAVRPVAGVGDRGTEKAANNPSKG